MTGEELNDYLNPHRRAKGMPTVRWANASTAYKGTMDSAAPGLALTGTAPTPAAPAQSVPAAAAAPATPSTPGVEPGMAVLVAKLSQKDAQLMYELLYTTRGCRIYKH